jgi:hypothetical protein
MTYKVIPKLDIVVDGPLKGWKSLKQARVYHYDVQQSFRFLFFRGSIDTQRVICVELEFTNGATYSSHGLFNPLADTTRLSQAAIYRALREFAKRSTLFPA